MRRSHHLNRIIVAGIKYHHHPTLWFTSKINNTSQTAICHLPARISNGLGQQMVASERWGPQAGNQHAKTRRMISTLAGLTSRIRHNPNRTHWWAKEFQSHRVSSLIWTKIVLLICRIHSHKRMATMEAMPQIAKVTSISLATWATTQQWTQMLTNTSIRCSSPCPTDKSLSSPPLLCSTPILSLSRIPSHSPSISTRLSSKDNTRPPKHLMKMTMMMMISLHLRLNLDSLQSTTSKDNSHHRDTNTQATTWIWRRAATQSLVAITTNQIQMCEIFSPNISSSSYHMAHKQGSTSTITTKPSSSKFHNRHWKHNLRNHTCPHIYRLCLQHLKRSPVLANINTRYHQVTVSQWLEPTTNQRSFKDIEVLVLSLLVLGSTNIICHKLMIPATMRMTNKTSKCRNSSRFARRAIWCLMKRVLTAVRKSTDWRQLLRVDATCNNSSIKATAQWALLNRSIQRLPSTQIRNCRQI